MTVANVGNQAGLLAKLKHEWQSADGEIEVETVEEEGVVNSDLTVGADVTSVSSLRANASMSLLGVKFYGQGFVLNAADAAYLSATSSRPLIKHFVGGQDLTQRPRELSVVDANGLDIEDLISTYPDAYQHLWLNVKPERDHNPREGEAIALVVVW